MYLGSILCIYSRMEVETREKSCAREENGSLRWMMKERTVNMEVMKGLRGGILVPTLTYASETWVWDERQRSKIQVVQMSNLRNNTCKCEKNGW